MSNQLPQEQQVSSSIPYTVGYVRAHKQETQVHLVYAEHLKCPPFTYAILTNGEIVEHTVTPETDWQSYNERDKLEIVQKLNHFILGSAEGKKAYNFVIPIRDSGALLDPRYYGYVLYAKHQEKEYGAKIQLKCRIWDVATYEKSQKDCRWWSIADKKPVKLAYALEKLGISIKEQILSLPLHVVDAIAAANDRDFHFAKIISSEVKPAKITKEEAKKLAAADDKARREAESLHQFRMSYNKPIFKGSRVILPIYSGAVQDEECTKIALLDLHRLSGNKIALIDLYRVSSKELVKSEVEKVHLSLCEKIGITPIGEREIQANQLYQYLVEKAEKIRATKRKVIDKWYSLKQLMMSVSLLKVHQYASDKFYIPYEALYQFAQDTYAQGKEGKQKMTVNAIVAPEPEVTPEVVNANYVDEANMSITNRHAALEGIAPLVIEREEDDDYEEEEGDEYGYEDYEEEEESEYDFESRAAEDPNQEQDDDLPF